MVYIQHDYKLVTAEIFTNVLENEGFPARVIKDDYEDRENQDNLAAVASSLGSRVGRTTLHSKASLSDADFSFLQQQLSKLPGVQKVVVDVAESKVLVDHD